MQSNLKSFRKTNMKTNLHNSTTLSPCISPKYAGSVVELNVNCAEFKYQSMYEYDEPNENIA